MLRGVFALSLVTLGLLTGCGSGVTNADLDGRQYVATAVSDPGAVPEIGELTLDFGAGHLSASGGCNGPSGPYVLRGDQLSFGEGAMVTLMGCSGPYEKQDDWIDDLLTPAATVSLHDGGRVLELKRGSRSATFGLQGPKDGPTPIEGQRRRADGFVGNSLGVGIEGPMIRPALRIADGTATIFAGCNSGTASAKIGDREIQFGPFSPTTHRPCGRYIGRVDQAVRKILSGDARVRFERAYTLIIEQRGKPGLSFRVSMPPRTG